MTNMTVKTIEETNETDDNVTEKNVSRLSNNVPTDLIK